MSLVHAKSLLTPSLASLGPTLAKLLHAKPDVREAGCGALAVLADRKLTAKDGIALVRLATEVTYLPQPSDWNDPVHELLFPLVENPHAQLLPHLRAAYGVVSELAKCAVLAAIAAIGTRAAAQAFMACVRAGWPKAVYGRVFNEAYNLAAHGDVMFPELALNAGRYLGDVTNVLIYALTSGKLDASNLDLEPLAPLAKRALADLTPKAARASKSGTKWRVAAGYAKVRADLGAWLDIAGHLRAPSLLPFLTKATSLHDPKLAGFAAFSLLRRKRPVAEKIWERVAADHETRRMLYDYLDNLGALEKFPARWRTWEAFACAAMAEWLMYPSELGYVPEEIELMKRLAAGRRAFYVWKFRSRKGWAAGVSGPYVEAGTPKPMHSSSTFSSFEPAAKKTPEEHALSVLGTLAKWDKARTKKKR